MNAIFNSTVTFVGRGSDMANTNMRGLSAKSRNQGLIVFHRRSLFILCPQTTTIQHHICLPRIYLFHLCFYFSMAYNLVMGGEKVRSSEKIFPSFAGKMFATTQEDNGDKELDSKVLELFNKLMDQYWSIMFEFFGESALSHFPHFLL